MSRRSNRAGRPAFLKEQGESGQSGGAASSRAAEQCEQPEPGEGDPFRGGIAMPNSLLGYQSRSPLFRTLSRSSSGYFSFDSEPSSPLVTHSASTQTPSPSSQVITHALQRIAEARGDAQSFELWPPYNHHPPHGAAPAGDMRPESYVAQELRRIGDEFNELYFQGAGRNGGRVQLLAEEEPAFMLWMGLVIGRLLQLLLRRR
ncbi:bcl-2-like protein 11 [Colossoma macropomum]|uniref:bcl-2-like protein 11 n=1 Tax=Colossoma macropomum TaxID=42526 RepID=UPI001864C95A|nr:bcl-2-like protein 11 [Colossoma macropomum]